MKTKPPRQHKRRERVWTGVRISPGAKSIVEALKVRLGLSQAAVMEIAIRHLGDKYHIGDQPGGSR